MLDWLATIIAFDLGATLAGDSGRRRTIREQQVIRRFVWAVVIAAVVVTIAALNDYLWLGVAAAILILLAIVIWMMRTRTDAHSPRG